MKKVTWMPTTFFLVYSNGVLVNIQQLGFWGEQPWFARFADCCGVNTPTQQISSCPHDATEKPGRDVHIAPSPGSQTSCWSCSGCQPGGRAAPEGQTAFAFLWLHIELCLPREGWSRRRDWIATGQHHPGVGVRNHFYHVLRDSIHFLGSSTIIEAHYFKNNMIDCKGPGVRSHAPQDENPNSPWPWEHYKQTPA